MQITFDPLNEDEANFVARIVSRAAERITIQTPAITVLTHADRPDVGATPEVPPAPSAAPLPPDAPSFAAVDLFPTVPAVPTASAPPVPPVPSLPAVAVPPAPPAPSAPATPANHADLDKNGLPWDERIHAGTKAKNADGSWRSRRGLNDEALVKRVEAELRQLVANNATSAAPLPDASAAPSPTPSTPTSAPSVPPVPPAPSAAIPASTPVPEINFTKLLDMMTKAIASQRLTEDQVDVELQAEGIDKTKIGLLVADKDKTQAIGARLWNLLGVVV